ncbi:E1 [Ailuropoda melanoleuca papillomavirus 4]|uniref:Replication protein E1 n=1 Tax=Ailuropoda melanoleuca papillomavirus 4 TaxID=2016453 RepID=A0A220IGE8_9PAPI|nr:E1 [Ailuropoda melanoleuca papillomavirus 4]
MEGDDLDRGTADPEEGPSGWYIVREAECRDTDEDEEEEESDGEADLTDLRDDTDLVDQGNSLELFHQREREVDELQVQALKRKYIDKSPSGPKQKPDLDLSPRLDAITITPPKQKAKRRLFEASLDSGLDLSGQNETLCSIGDTEEAQQVQVQQAEGGAQGGSAGGAREGAGAGHGGPAMVQQIMKSSNQRATMHAMFKEAYGMGFGELTRTFKSDKTCNEDWVTAVFGVRPTLYEGLKTLLQAHCEYMYLTSTATRTGLIVLLLLRFKAHKCRDTLVKLLRSMLSVSEYQIMAEPPKVRSVPAALYWYKTSMSSTTDTQGTTPEWISRQTMLSHQTADEQKFDLSAMIQWAFDNEYTDECTIAYEYAKLADEDMNAAAWLSTNAQAKYVKDCCCMVRLYRRGIMRSMTMSEWVQARKDRVKGVGDWRHIVNFLKYQEVEFVGFLGALRHLLNGTPKRNCIAICGPPNTGKSQFCMSLLAFLGGNVISFANAKSQFWLQPLADTRLALLDDATKPCWDYVDTYLRNALDGNPICLDLKHRAPMQIKCPPLLITSNIVVGEDDRWRYLHSRIKCFCFKNEFPFNVSGQPTYCLNDENWKCFFERLWLQLGLKSPEDEGNDGEPQQAFRCGARKPSEPI